MSTQRYRKNRFANRDKRDSDATCDKDASALSPTERQFLLYQESLDARHDKYERIVKLSRDITIDSKRIIFLLHRNTEKQQLIEEAKSKLDDVQANAWYAVAEELLGEDPFLYNRAFSPGLQEYIEALSFCYYIEHGKLISLQEVQQTLDFTVTQSTQLPKADVDSNETMSPSENAQLAIKVLVTPADYILGIADLTGELMRMAINSVGAGKLDVPHKICALLHDICSGLELFGNIHREMSTKLNVLRDSVRKVETACYSLQIRGSEIPQHMLPNLFQDASDEVVHSRTENSSNTDE